MAFYVYFLRCADGSYYTGHTDNIEARVIAHQLGEVPGYTQLRRPVQLGFVQEVPSRQVAFERERQIKVWSRAKKQALIEQDWTALVELARAHGSTSSP